MDKTTPKLKFWKDPVFWTVIIIAFIEAAVSVIYVLLNPFHVDYVGKDYTPTNQALVFFVLLCSITFAIFIFKDRSIARTLCIAVAFALFCLSLVGLINQFELFPFLSPFFKFIDTDFSAAYAGFSAFWGTIAAVVLSGDPSGTESTEEPKETETSEKEK